MSEAMKKGLVPALRFPAFQDSGEWEQKAFGNLGLDISDGNYSSKYPSQSDFIKIGIPFLRANNLKFGTVTDEDMRFISKDQHNKITKGHLKKGDILITTRGELGIIALVPDRHIGSNINAQIVRINTDNKLVNTFLFQLLDYSRIIGLFDALSTGTALKQLPIGKLNQLNISIPKIKEEQQKIADCLSSIDELVTAQTQKVEALKVHKKGLMQQLFPAEGETVPQLRFNEFSGEWILHKIGDFIESYKGGAALTPSDFAASSDCEVIPKKAITEGGWLKIDNEKPTYCTEEFYKNNLQSVVDSTYLITTLRDLVPSGPSIGYIVKYVGNKNYILAQGVYGLKPKRTIIADFLIHFSNSDIYRKMMQSVMVGSTQVHIRNSTYLGLPICVPLLEEQQKIANCLSSIDDLITAQTQKLATLKAHKKGLMQQLFAAVDDDCMNATTKGWSMDRGSATQDAKAEMAE